MISACVTSNSSKVSEEPSNEINFNAHYIRTNPMLRTEKYPSVMLISSKAELEQYYNERYDVSAYPYLEQSSELKNAVEGYSEQYFQEKFLLIVLLEESSGGIRHKVETIEENGNIVISRLLPEMGTSDMAEWNILIELDRTIELEEFTICIKGTK
jgi:hypothetical protein